MVCGAWSTQNVDGLHAAAGSTTVVDLHGEIAVVICLDCGERTSRKGLQDRLALLNPGVVGRSLPVTPSYDRTVTPW